MSRGLPRKAVGSAGRGVVGAIAVALIASSLLAGAWLLFPPLTHYRAALEQGLAAHLRVPVRIRNIDIGWDAWGPVLIIHDFKLFDPRGTMPLAGFEQARIGLDLAQTLANGRLALGHVQLEGGSLMLEIREGNLRLATPTPSAIPISLRDIVAWLLTVKSLELVFHRVQLDDGRGQTMTFRDLLLDLSDEGEKQRLELNADLPEWLGNHVQATVKLSGEADDPTTWDAGFHGYAKGLKPGYWSKPLGHDADAVIWGHWSERQPQIVLGKITLHEPDLSGASPNGQVAKLATDFNWSNQDKGWHWYSRSLGTTRRGIAALDMRADLTLKETSNDSPHRLQGHVENLPLRDLTTLAAPHLNAPHRQLLEALAPSGQLPELAFEVDLVDERATLPPFDIVSLASHFQDLSLHAWRNLPEIRGLNGKVSLTQDRGQLTMDSHRVEITAEHLLRNPMTFQRLAGALQWHRDSAGWRIESPGLEIENDDLHGRLRGSVLIAGEGANPLLDLRMNYRDIDIGRITRYLPAKAMKPKLVKWLDRALVSGRISEGELICQGHLADFPFDEGQGLFETRFRVQDAILDYKPQWPRLEELEAEAIFKNHTFSARAVAGKLFAAELERANARIDNLARPMLAIQGHIQGPTASMLRFLRKSPLKSKVGGYVEGLEATGESTLDLALTIPLGRRLKHIPIRVQGDIALAGNDLTLASKNLAFNQVRGNLNFTRSGLSAKDLRLLFRGQPARLEIGKDPAGVRFQLRGALSVQELLGKPGAALQTYLPGRSRWNIVLIAPPAKPGAPATYDLALTSELHGTEVKLPSPLGKAAHEKRTLQVNTRLREGDDMVLDLTYAPHIHALLELSNDRKNPRFKRGELRIDTGRPKLPKHTGLAVVAHIAHFEPSLSLSQAGSLSPPPWLNTLQAQFDELTLGNQTFANVDIDTDVRQDAVTIRVTGKTLAGHLKLPTTPTINKPVEVKLQRLVLNGNQRSQSTATGSIDPRNLPPLRIAVEEFTLADQPLGQMLLSTRPGKQGLELENLELTSPFYRIAAKGNWRVTTTGQSSHLQAKLYSRRPGQALEKLGYKAKLEEGETKVELDVRWPAALIHFDAGLLEGDLNLHIGKGSLPDIDPGIGRMVGLFSLDSLSRRLRMDFSDLSDAGLSFDNIQGNFSFHDGYATTRDLVLAAPSAQVAITGRTDLKNRRYDQTVTVTPDVGLSLPIAGTIAGGPIVGAALLIAGRIFKPGIDEIGSYRYSVTGSWDNPAIEPIAPAANSNEKQGFTRQ